MRRIGCTLAALVAVAVVIGTLSRSKAEFAAALRAEEPMVSAVRNSLSNSLPPFAFVPNAGQMEERVRYSARAAGATVYFSSGDVVFAFNKGKKGRALQLNFLGANPEAEPAGIRLGTGTVNYLIGDSDRWRTGLPTYGEIVYRDLWPGIDLAFRGEKGELKYEFRVAPGADPNDISLAYRGIRKLSIGKAGDLRIHTPLGIMHDSQPVSYQEIGGQRVSVASRYTIAGRSYGFSTDAYDHTHALVIDPGLDYSTYLGGSGAEHPFDMAVDASGSAYVTGGLFMSSDFPTTPGAFDGTFAGNDEAFVTKLDPSGNLVYSTFLGGSGSDGARGIAVDNSGCAYVTGTTLSSDFPTTVGAFDTTLNGGDIFIAKLNPSGSALVYSTLLGGSSSPTQVGGAFGHYIAVDAFGSAYVTGNADESDFPTTPGAFDTTGFSGNGFVTKLNPAGSALEYSTFLAGSGSSNSPLALTVDNAGSAYVTGVTSSADFPTTPGAFDRTRHSALDSFVTKLNPTGSALEYSTFLGGGGDDQGNAIAVDSTGSAYVTGSTRSQDFPTTTCAFDRTRGGGQDPFVTKLNPTGSAIQYSTYLGSSSVGASHPGEEGFGIAVDASGSAVVTGAAAAADFPTTSDAFDNTFSFDAFVTRLSASGSFITYSTFLGGSAGELGVDVALDAMGHTYVTGFTSSNDFPTAAASDATFGGGSQDVFVTKMTLPAGPAELAAVPATIQLTPTAAQNQAGTSATLTASVANPVGNPLANVIVNIKVTGSRIVSGSCITGANGQCDFSYQGPVFNGSDSILGFVDLDNDTVKDPCEPSATATNTWTGNGPPFIGNPGTQTSFEGDIVSLPILATDPDGNTLTYTAIGLPLGLAIDSATGVITGTVDFTAGGSFDDDGNPIPARAYSVTVHVSDGLGTTGRSFDWTVINVSAAPVALPVSATTSEDAATQITLTASDADGDPLTYSVFVQPTHGTVTLLGGVATYTPAPNYNGTDTFSFRANDGTNNSNVATVSINVSAINDTPIAQTDSATTTEDTPINISVLSNDSDVDGDATSVGAVTLPANGVVVINADGTVTYTPSLNFFGNDSFAYTVADGHGGTASTTVNVSVSPVNDIPTALSGVASLNEDAQGEVTLAAADVDSSVCSFTVITAPINGTLSAVVGGKVVYTPDPNYNGPDSFTFLANDGTTDSNVATVTLAVSPLADVPLLATIGNQVIAEGALLSLDLSGSDPDGEQLTFSASGLPIGATLDPATGSFSWTPTFDQAGSYTLTFTVTDPTSRSASETITINVSDVGSNLGPVCSAAYPSISELWSPNHEPQLIDIFGVTDPNNDPITIIIRRIFQDEPTNTEGDGNTWIDGGGVGTSQAWVRAERSGTRKVSPLNGRVYEIFFDASDGRGKSCTGSVKVGVPHDQSRGPAVDDGKRYDSTVAGGPCLNCNP